MARLLSKHDAKAIEDLIETTIEEIGERDPRYAALYKAYNNFDAESNTAATIADVAKAIRLVSSSRADELQAFLNEKIRQSNYPSNWDQPSKVARDTYMTANPATVTPGLYWHCPGHGVGAHDVAHADITIDHVTPVASHWNTTGHNTDRVTRHNWYWDTSNHAYLCRACNSRRGSGGTTYNIALGASYSN